MGINIPGKSHAPGGGATFTGGTVANATTFSSLVTLGAGLDAGDGNITNVGGIALDTITSDAGASITISPATDNSTFFSNGTGVVIGHDSSIATSNTATFQLLGTGGSDSTALLARFKDNDKGPTMRFLKSRNDTIGSHAIIQDDDIIGRFNVTIFVIPYDLSTTLSPAKVALFPVNHLIL